jgi:hypothetical protein
MSKPSESRTLPANLPAAAHISAVFFRENLLDLGCSFPKNLQFLLPFRRRFPLRRRFPSINQFHCRIVNYTPYQNIFPFQSLEVGREGIGRIVQNSAFLLDNLTLSPQLLHCGLGFRQKVHGDGKKDALKFFLRTTCQPPSL